jgi:hypothetical protein
LNQPSTDQYQQNNTTTSNNINQSDLRSYIQSQVPLKPKEQLSKKRIIKNRGDRIKANYSNIDSVST